MSSLLEAHPKLKEEAQRLILKLLPTVQALLAQKDGKIDAGTVTQATALIDNLSALGSRSLKADSVQLKKDLCLDVTSQTADLENRLDILHKQIADTITAIPETDRKLVTGHAATSAPGAWIADKTNIG